MDLVGTLAKVKDYIEMQEYPEAVALCKETLMELEKSGYSQENERKKMQVLFSLSDACNVAGNWIDGLTTLPHVIAIATRLSDQNMLAEAIIRSGDIHSKMGKWDKALNRYSEAETLLDSFKNSYLLGRLHIGRGVILWRQGKYRKAAEHAREARRLGLETGNPQLVGSASSLMASIHFDTREYLKAIEENDRALETCRSCNDILGMARILNNKGEVYKLIGEYDKALGIFEEGLEVLANTNNNRSLAYLHMNLAECHIRLGNMEESGLNTRKADAMASISEDKYIRAQLFLVKGLIADFSGDNLRALEYISKGEAMMKKLDIPYDQGVMQLEHARMLRKSDAHMAMEYYRMAISSFRKADMPEMVNVVESEMKKSAI